MRRIPTLALGLAVTAAALTVTGCDAAKETAGGIISTATAAVASAAEEKMNEVKDGVNATGDVTAGPTSTDGDRTVAQITATNPKDQNADYTVMVTFRDAEGTSSTRSSSASAVSHPATPRPVRHAAIGRSRAIRRQRSRRPCDTDGVDRVLTAEPVSSSPAPPTPEPPLRPRHRVTAWAAGLLLVVPALIAACRVLDTDAITPVPQLLSFLPWLTVPAGLALLLAATARRRVLTFVAVLVLGATAWSSVPYMPQAVIPYGLPLAQVRVIAANVEFGQGTRALTEVVRREHPSSSSSRSATAPAGTPSRRPSPRTSPITPPSTARARSARSCSARTRCAAGG